MKDKILMQKQLASFMIHVMQCKYALHLIGTADGPLRTKRKVAMTDALAYI